MAKTPDASQDLNASIVLRRDGRFKVDERGMVLLERIAALGSISAAARDLGISYRAAWDAVRAMNNLFERPLVKAAAGGDQGGSAELTAEGRAALTTWRLAHEDLAGAFARFEQRMTGQPGAPMAWRGMIVRTSAQNAYRGVIEQITDGAVNAEVILKVTDGLKIVAIITREAVESLDLTVGATALALIKSSFVVLAPETVGRTSARNQLTGTVVDLKPGAVNTEVVLDLGAGKTLTATITRDSADAMALAPGARLTGLIKAQHVILVAE